MFMLVCMMMMMGVAIDLMHYEVTRTKLQNTLDRAVLAAADLDQSLEAQDVVSDYFARMGLVDYPISVSIEDGLNYRTVSAATEVEISTMFMDLLGIESMVAPAAGTANETIQQVEISLVLDNSGSMASNNRLNLLKDAANTFVESVLEGSSDDVGISISIVPFATQVSAGEDILAYYNVTDEHDYSHCVDFSSSDFESASLSQTQQLQRTGHFDPFTWSNPPGTDDLVCVDDGTRDILPLSESVTDLQAKINSFWADGNTSIDVATKWGLTMLDPGTRPVVSGLISEGKIPARFEGRPFDYDEPETLKVLVVMSDGQNTTQYMLDEDYRDGNSPLYTDRFNGWDTYYRNRSRTSYDYFMYYYDTWWYYPFQSWDRAKRLTWPEVWDKYSLAYFAYYRKREALGGNWESYYYDFYDTVSASSKNTRTSNICAEARENGIMVYTIGMETYGQGDATLLDCASSPSHFYDVDGTEIDEAFSSIARQINQLRLTH